MLSGQFGELLTDAGIVARRNHAAKHHGCRSWEIPKRTLVLNSAQILDEQGGRGSSLTGGVRTQIHSPETRKRTNGGADW
jgi:hypothetical protein